MMRSIARVTVLLALVLGVGTSLLTVGGASAEGATVVKGTGCGVLDGDGTFVFDANARILQLTTPSGNNLVTCRGFVTPPSSGETAVFKNGCNSFGESTTNAIEVVRPNGGYSLECRFNPSGQ